MNNGILKVTEETKATIDATGVKLHITIQGENFIFGNAAIEKCQDVKLAISKIISVDKDAQVSVDGVTIKSETGWFAKGSKGGYRLTIKLGELAKINDVLGAIMELKNVTMDYLEWEYNEYAAKVTLIEDSVKRCKNKAEVMAAALGNKIVGIKTCSDSYEVPEDNMQMRAGGSALGSGFIQSRKGAMPGDFGTEVRGKKGITAVATVEFYVVNNSSV